MTSHTSLEKVDAGIDCIKTAAPSFIGETNYRFSNGGWVVFGGDSGPAWGLEPQRF
jgi:hypothetical protein